MCGGMHQFSIPRPTVMIESHMHIGLSNLIVSSVVMTMDMEYAHVDGYYGLKMYNALYKTKEDNGSGRCSGVNVAAGSFLGRRRRTSPGRRCPVRVHEAVAAPISNPCC